MLLPLLPLLLCAPLVQSLATPGGVSLPSNVSLSELIDTDPSALVNLFIGTTNGGHCFPGATVPHGMIKVGLDTDSPGNVRFFTLLHAASPVNTVNSKQVMMAIRLSMPLDSVSCTIKGQVVPRLCPISNYGLLGNVIPLPLAPRLSGPARLFAKL
jgi:hypothetical protein